MALVLTKDTNFSETIDAEFHTPIHIEINNMNNSIEVLLGSYISEADFDGGKERIKNTRVLIDMSKFDVGQLKFMEDIEDFIDDLIINGATLTKQEDKDEWKDSVKKKKTKSK